MTIKKWKCTSLTWRKTCWIRRPAWFTKSIRRERKQYRRRWVVLVLQRNISTLGDSMPRKRTKLMTVVKIPRLTAMVDMMSSKQKMVVTRRILMREQMLRRVHIWRKLRNSSNKLLGDEDAQEGEQSGGGIVNVEGAEKGPCQGGRRWMLCSGACGNLFEYCRGSDGSDAIFPCDQALWKLPGRSVVLVLRRRRKTTDKGWR